MEFKPPEERVPDGANRLDKDAPDWPIKITKKINTGSTHDCPLAQVYGDYETGRKALGLTHDEAFELGFRSDVRELGWTGSRTKFYQKLDELWQQEFVRRCR